MTQQDKDKIVIAVCGYASVGKDTVAKRLIDSQQFTKVSFAGPLKRAAGKIFGLNEGQLNDARLKEAALTTHIWPFQDTAHMLELVAEATLDVYDLPKALFHEDTRHTPVARFPFTNPGYIVRSIQLNFMTAMYPHLRDVVETKRPVYFPNPRILLQLLGTEVYRAFHSDTWTEAWKREAARYQRVIATDCRFNNEVAVVRDVGGTVWRVDSNHPWVKRETRHISEREFLNFGVDRVLPNHSSVGDLHAEVDMAFRAILDRARGVEFAA